MMISMIRMMMVMTMTRDKYIITIKTRTRKEGWDGAS